MEITQGSRQSSLIDGTARLAKIRWYEAQGIGRKEFEIKRYLD
jgi:hypothetical protein